MAEGIAEAPVSGGHLDAVASSVVIAGVRDEHVRLLGHAVPNFSSPTSSRNVRAVPTGFPSPNMRGPKATFSSTDIQGNSESPWKIIEFAGRERSNWLISTRPSLCRSSPARIRNKVVLPQPLGPTMTKNSPFGMSIPIPSNATKPERPKYFRTPDRDIWISSCNGSDVSFTT